MAEDWKKGFPRGHTWGRIETISCRRLGRVRHVSPGVTPGGGLKLKILTLPGLAEKVSPGVTPGGGLKQKPATLTAGHTTGFPRGHTWGRIETAMMSSGSVRPAASFPRGHTWGRIETLRASVDATPPPQFPPGSHLGAD